MISGRQVVLILLIAGFASRNTFAADVSMTSAEFTAARVAERYIATHYPNFDSIKDPPVVTSADGKWVVTYEHDPLIVGGGKPEIEIDKATLEVIKAGLSQ